MSSISRRARSVLGLLGTVLWGAIACSPSQPPAPPVIDVAQSAGRIGLSDSERAEFYHLDEGSEVFPVDWFVALESESGNGLFTQNLERFGLIPDATSASNPFGLPVGITAADTRDLRDFGVKMIGVNCAACHVAEVTVNGKPVRLDGAGGRSDISKFYGALAKATVATATSPQKFLAFLKRVHDGRPHALLSERDAQRAETTFESLAAQGASAFDQAVERQLLAALEEEMKKPTEPLPGELTLKPGTRQESLSTAVRQRLTRDLSDNALARYIPRGESADSSALANRVGRSEVGLSIIAAVRDAVSKLRLFKARVEFLVRLAQRMDVKATPPGYGRIDAFGGARNLLFASHSRDADAPVSYPHLWNFEGVTWLHWDANTTSVLERNIGQALGLGAVLDPASFASTISVVNLHRLEQLAKKIRPPRWTDTFGAIDEDAAARGAELFTEHCASCHAPGKEVEIELDKIGTDRRRAENFAAPVGEVANAQAIADLVGKIKRKAFDEKGLSDEQRRLLDGPRKPEWRFTSKYVARPLVAPWASAPYLHNNSVPTLAALLLPPAKRPPQFFVGSAEYDVKDLGVVSSERPGAFLFDTRTAGNSHGGHDYGTALSDQDRGRLLEYLKKL